MQHILHNIQYTYVTYNTYYIIYNTHITLQHICNIIILFPLEEEY